MASLRCLALAMVGGVFGTVSIAATMVGCGGDDSGTAMDSGATPDVTTMPDVGQRPDVAQTPEASRDTGLGSIDGRAEAAIEAGGDADAAVGVEGGDAGRDADATIPDAGVGRDAGADADGSASDGDASNSDADGSISHADASDADASNMGDAADAMDGDAEGGPNAIQQYAIQYGQAFCAGQGKCCPGYPATFDQASCAKAWSTVGWEYTLPAAAAAYAAGHLTFNATQGAACLSALQSFACTTGGTVTAVQYRAVTTACLGVLTGTIPIGSGGCVSSFECASGYCSLAADGGTGTCTALLASGATCQQGTEFPDQMCSQAGAHQPALWCNSLSGGPTGTCAAPLADGVTCYNPVVSATYYDDYGCASLLCGDDALCGHVATYPTPPPGFCENWPADAGHD